MRPLCIDLFCGLGGFSAGPLAEGYDCIGFDVERHLYGEHRYPAQLVIQDVLTLHGSQFRDAALIVASPPCQFFSYTAMPWSKAKALAAKVRADQALLEEKLALFNACFRIQREACEAAGRHIPMVVENVRGAEPWVGRARWSHGSFYLWGNVPALMPIALRAVKVPGFRFDGSGKSFQTASVDETGRKTAGMNWSDRTKRGQDFTRIAMQQRDPMWKRGFTQTAVDQRGDGIKCGGDWFNSKQPSISRTTSSKSLARKAASAMIAKIPEALSRHIARCFLPDGYGAKMRAAE
jgi:C-5 cytosine-specific DNA methylase